MREVTGIGIDMCLISRMEEYLDTNPMVWRFFTKEEQINIIKARKTGSQKMAGMWAAKEATLKALGCGIKYPMADVEITYTEEGQPQIALHGKIQADYFGCSFLVSITHEGEYAVAIVEKLEQK